MKTVDTRDENTAFEAWAQLLISRKVPERYRHFIDQEVVGEGAAILKRGEAFEVLVFGCRMDAAGGSPEPCVDGRISVAPIPVLAVPSHVHG